MIARIVLISTIVVLMAFGVSGCGGEEAAGGTRVVAAFYPLAYAAEQVGGGGIEVRNLTPAGTEPHDFELTAQDVKAVRGADLVVYLGDGFMPALERAVAGREGPSLDLLHGQRLEQDAEGERGEDPHIWLDPVRYATMARAIAAAIGNEATARPLVRRLGALDTSFRRGLTSCRRRQIVTSHAAFGYLASRYGLEQVALTGLSPEAEPSARSIAKLVHRVEATGATTVFFEPLLSPELAKTVAREAGVDVAVLDPLEGIGEDELAAGADYFSVMRHNLASLRRALDCA